MSGGSLEAYWIDGGELCQGEGLVFGHRKMIMDT